VCFYFILFLFFCFVFFIIQSIAFVTLFERHLLSLRQNRLGPNKVVFLGFFQPIFDGFKLMKKELLFLEFSSDVGFFLFSLISFVVLIIDWFVLPLFYFFMCFEFGVLFFLCVVGFFVYCILLSGLLRKSKYGLLGSIRSCSQSVSYEVVFSIFLLVILFHWGCFCFYYSFYLDLVFFLILYLIIVILEMGRAPFDFSESESELVRGYNVEYSRLGFVFFCF